VAIFGLPMTAAETALYWKCTGLTSLPTAPFREAVLIISGRTREGCFIRGYQALHVFFRFDEKNKITPNSVAVG
jgi:hypothetical protein